jgi:UTP--glucose-1-phosphate uridylyltransferase
MIRKVVLPAAGHGTRLRPLTSFIPKEMLPLGSRLVLHHVLAECRLAGLDRILAVVSRAKGALVEAMEGILAEEAGSAIFPQVHYVYQRVQGGLGHAVMHAETFAGSDAFAVALADTVIAGEKGACGLLARLIEAHEAEGAVATIAVEEVETARVSRYGIVRPKGARSAPSRPGERFRIVDLVEKPSPAEAPSNLAIAARYVLSPEIFEALRHTAAQPLPGRESAPRELQITDAIAALARAGRPVVGVRLAPEEKRFDIGNPRSYREAFERLAE